MKKILFTIFALGYSATLFAQSPDKALSRVTYTFTHVQDTNKRDEPHVEEMLLVVGRNASLYTSYEKIKQDAESQRQIQEQLKNQVSSGGSISLKVERNTTKRLTDIDYFFFSKEQKFITKERVFNNYLIEEEIPKIQWKITRDTATFAGIKCQKATASFKGRNWIAWFAPDLPFQSGPWKLNGLPGLIIEAQDEKNEVLFQFAGMEKVEEDGKKSETENLPQIMAEGNKALVRIVGMDSGNSYMGNEITLPADAIKTSRKEIDKLKDARAKDPQGFMQAQLAGSGVQIGRSSNFTMRTNAPGTKFVVNNPIELSEN